MRRRLLICCLLAATTLAVYWPVRQYGFIAYDDPDFVSRNPHVRTGLTWENLKCAWSAPLVGLWHPVTALSLMLDCELFGPKPGPLHLVNAAFHLANGLLLFLLLEHMTGAAWRSALAAALFALHPLRVESVAWIAERKDVLSVFFFLLTLLAYARYVQSKVQSEGRGSRVEGGGAAEASTLDHFHAPRSTLHAPIWYVLALVFFALGLMSKPMLITLPFVLLLLDYWPLGRPELKIKNLKLRTSFPLLREKLPFFALSAVSCWIVARLGKSEGMIVAEGQMTLTERLAISITNYLKYLGKACWPTDLAVLYPNPGRHYPVSDHWPGWQVAAAVLLLAVLSAFCLCQLRRRPFLAVGWFWYLGTLVPVIGLFEWEHALADRYTYIPMIGPVVALVWLAAELWGPGRRRRAALAGLGGGAVAACVLLTRHQLQYWRDTVTLFEHTVAVTADNPVAQCNLGYGLVLEGKPDWAGPHYLAALAIRPHYKQALSNLGALLKYKQLWPQAAARYEAVLQRDPSFYLAHLALAEILPRLGRFQEAAAHMEEALKLKPDLPPESLNDLAWELATSAQPEARDGAHAVVFAETACKLTDYQQTVMLGTLAAAYAEAGRFPEAIRAAETACGLARRENKAELLAKNQQLLELYRAGRPYHEAQDQGKTNR